MMSACTIVLLPNAIDGAGRRLPVDATRITKHYMRHNSPTTIVSLRIERSLLAAVRESADSAGRSVSGQIVYFVREHVAAGNYHGRPKRISGWLADRDAPPSHGEFRRARAKASKRIRTAVRLKARTK